MPPSTTENAGARVDDRKPSACDSACEFAERLSADDLRRLRDGLADHFAGTAHASRYQGRSSVPAALLVLDRQLVDPLVDDLSTVASVLNSCFDEICDVAWSSLPFVNRRLMDHIREHKAAVDSDGLVPLRFDLFLEGAGQVFEINAGNIAGLPGIVSTAGITSAYLRSLPWLADWLAERQLAVEDPDGIFPDFLRRTWGAPPRTVAWVSDIQGDRFADVYRGYGYNVIVSDFPGDMSAWSLRTGGLHLAGTRVDGVFLSVDPENLFAHCPADHPLITGYCEGIASFSFSLLQSFTLAEKALLAFVTDPVVQARLFTDEQTAAVQRVFARTWLLTSDLAHDIVGNREEWVIKPSGSVSGHGVVVGAAATATEWFAAVSGAVSRGGYVCQRRLAPSELPSAHLTAGGCKRTKTSLLNVSPVLVDGSVQSWLARFSSSVNIAWSRGELAPVVLSPKPIKGSSGG